jgi:antitoxin YefM
METIFKLKTKELDMSFIESIKNLFKGKEIEITIKSAQDETEYLLSTPANKKKLFEAIDEVKRNKNLIRFSGKEFEEMTQKLLNS